MSFLQSRRNCISSVFGDCFYTDTLQFTETLLYRNMKGCHFITRSRELQGWNFHSKMEIIDKDCHVNELSSTKKELQFLRFWKSHYFKALCGSIIPSRYESLLSWNNPPRLLTWQAFLFRRNIPAAKSLGVTRKWAKYCFFWLNKVHLRHKSGL